MSTTQRTVKKYDRPWRLTATLRPGDDPALHVGHYRLVCHEPGPAPAAPSRASKIHTCGYVFREGCYGWSAAPLGDRPAFGGYRTRALAAAALWEDWRANNMRVPLLLNGKVVPASAP